ncbi:MAG: T9SS type A sorting domain-containing protein [Bacteroidota bacterium]
MTKIIKHIITISAILLTCWSSSFAQLVISPGSSITIKEGTSMYIGTDLYIKSDISGSGYLADQNSSGNCTITGIKTVERYLTSNGWHNASSPVSNSNSTVFTGTDLVFYYDETIILNDWNFGWVWHQGALSVMKGYDLYLETSITASYIATTSSNLNTGSYSIGITRTDVSNGELENRKGWNLIGNPYPSPIDWLEESGWDKTDINDAKYIWNPTNNNYTIFIGGSSPTGINEGTQYIPSNQGFWVQATQNGNISVGNSTRLGIMTSTPDYYKNSNPQELRLIASANGYTDETMIRFILNATSKFDLNKDASKLTSSHDSVPQLYTVAGSTLLGINSLPEITNGLAIDMNFSCKTSGNYSIAIDDMSTINPFEEIYLKDIREQKIINLTKENKYYFFHEPSNSKQRFIIYFNPSQDIINNIKPESYFTVNSYKNTVTIIRNTTAQHDCKVSIYNLLGQKMSSFEITDNLKTTIQLPIPTGYYIVSITTKDYISNSKIRISNTK